MFVFRNFEIPLNRNLRNGLTYIFGVGRFKTEVISSRLGFAQYFTTNDLNVYNWFLITFMLRYKLISEILMNRIIETDVRNLVEMDSYKGLRHKLLLPVRGQRTRTNAGTRISLRKFTIWG